MPKVEKYNKDYEELLSEAQDLVDRGYQINPVLYAKAKMQEQEQNPVEDHEVEVSYPIETK